MSGIDRASRRSCSPITDRPLDLLHSRPLKSLSRSSSVASRKIAALNSLVASTGRRASLLASRESTDSTVRRPSIRRVDVAPTTTTTSIQAIDALFEQHRKRDPVVAGRASSQFSRFSSVSSECMTLDLAAKELSNELQLSVCTSSKQCGTDENCPPSPTATTSTVESSSDTLAQPSSVCKDDTAQPPLINELLDTLFPHLPPNAKPYHAYYNVATVDGAPAIPDFYSCPTSMCTEQFLYFESLQTHWSAHPWNRRGVLVPVTAGGIRRLSFWQHKLKFVKSLIQGPHDASAFETSNRPPTSQKRTLWNAVLFKNHSTLVVGSAGGVISTSDYGDIRLLGPRSYLVSPRVLSLEQVRVWEAERDSSLLPRV